MVFSRLFQRGAKDREVPAPPATVPQPPILVRQSVFEDADDTKIVSALIDEYVNPLTQRGFYLRSELPANAMRSYHTDYYMAQVANGGHGQFMHNSRMQPLILRDIREGLAAIGIEPYVGVFRDFEAFAASDPKRAEVSGKAGFGQPDPTEAELNKRFFAGDCYKTLMPANGRWLKGLPELKVVPDAEFAASIEALIAANPQAKARRAAGKRDRIAGMLQDTLHVAARLLAFQKNILPVNIGGGNPSARTPDGRAATGWAIVSQQGMYTMFVLEDVALLCEEYLADGRKVTREVMNEMRSIMLSGKPDLAAINAFGQPKVLKEVARIPVTLVEEAKAVARDGNVLAAAEIACARLDDEVVDLYPQKGTGKAKVWGFLIWGKRGPYIMALRSNGMVVTRIASDGKPGESVLLTLDEVSRYRVANEGGHA